MKDKGVKTMRKDENEISRREHERIISHNREIEKKIVEDKAIEEEKKRLEKLGKEKEKEYRPQSEELRDLHNTEKKYNAIIHGKSQADLKDQEKIKNYNYLKERAEMLNKVNKNIAECKDKQMLDKLNARKEKLEEDIKRNYKIEKPKSKLFQSKEKTKQIEFEYQNRIENRLNELGKQKEAAEKNIAERQPNKISYKEHEKMIRPRVQEKLKEQEKAQEKLKGQGIERGGR